MPYRGVPRPSSVSFYLECGTLGNDRGNIFYDKVILDSVLYAGMLSEHIETNLGENNKTLRS